MTNFSANHVNKKLLDLGFCGSYRSDGRDIVFLLEKCNIEPTSVEEKEKKIQSGQAHYSQMVSKEAKPSPEHIKHFNAAMALGAARMAEDVQRLGNALLERFKNKPIVLVSLIRAGAPLGVLLKYHISRVQPCFHYGISIIRDKGIDYAALHAIISEHGAQNIVFVDGWTGKGAISDELTKSLKDYPELFDKDCEIPRLVTLSDLGGCAWLTASAQDWLIPSGILGSVISGLTSRSILIDQIEPTKAKEKCFKVANWHKCIVYDELQQSDRSLGFTLEIFCMMLSKPLPKNIIATWSNEDRKIQNDLCKSTINQISKKYKVKDINRIKPSIAEATRAVLRRVPDRILIKDPNNPNLKLLLHFAEINNVCVDVVPDLLGPYQAVTIIKGLTSK